MSNEAPIIISDDDDDLMEVNSVVSSATSGHRRRAPDTLHPDRQRKRSRSDGQQSTVPPASRASTSQPAASMPGPPPVARPFPYPRNAGDLSEEVVSLLLNEDEAMEATDAWNVEVRRLSNFTFFDGTSSGPTRPMITLDKLKTHIIHGHGTARVAYTEADEDLIDNEDDAQQLGLRWKSEEVLLDRVEDWWMGDGINNACAFR